jgi:hypothetical protein
VDSIVLAAEPSVGALRGALTLASFVAAAAATQGAFKGGEGTLTADFYHPTGGGGGSCPFVYSNDGRGWVFEAEPFAGAVFRGMQRTTVDRLDHSGLTKGIARLKITCELDETEHIEQLRFQVVDHAVGTIIIPAEDGRLCVLGAVESPIWAMDSDGLDAMDFITESDEQEWSASLAGRDPDQPDQVRAGLTIAFQRPPDATEAVLVLDLKNTPWATRMLREVLELNGRELESWYTTLNTSPLVRSAFLNALNREAMLQVAIREDDSWRPCGRVGAVGHGVNKLTAVVVDLAGSTGDTVTIRLDSGAGFWAIDRIGIGFFPTDPVAVTTLEPTMARDQDGHDLRDALRSVDGVYYEMPTTQDWAELEFTVPPAGISCQRSFVLETTGYYKMHIHPEGEPRQDLLARFMVEPGAFAAYSMERYREVVSAQAERGQP